MSKVEILAMRLAQIGIVLVFSRLVLRAAASAVSAGEELKDVD